MDLKKNSPRVVPFFLGGGVSLVLSQLVGSDAIQFDVVGFGLWGLFFLGIHSSFPLKDQSLLIVCGGNTRFEIPLQTEKRKRKKR